ncbi:MAG: metallophosphoesterase family protein [Candidatus Aenigmarchaeota archaeon]|nr:metallophosphoesterase family protein [Candidatus Aenigmarchaeota archaeon]
MKIATVSCIHGDIENMMKFMDKISLLNIDIIVCNGDFTDYAIPRGFNRIDIGRIILEELKSLDKPLVTVPGSWDKELITLLKKETISCHGEGKIIDGVGFYGYGGAKTPFNTPFEPSESEMASGLEKAYRDVRKADVKIQVTHAPPFNTKADVIASGAHVGSDSVRKFIEKEQPESAVCAHIHESRCVDELGNTKIVNSGRFPEGHLGIISIDDSEVTAKLTSLI